MINFLHKKFAEYEIMSTFAARKRERRRGRVLRNIETKNFFKKVAKKFGDNEKVRIFAVPKRKGGQPGRMKGKSSLKILKRQAV